MVNKLAHLPGGSSKEDFFITYAARGVVIVCPSIRCVTSTLRWLSRRSEGLLCRVEWSVVKRRDLRSTSRPALWPYSVDDPLLTEQT
jgi:hypothetical protein